MLYLIFKLVVFLVLFIFTRKVNYVKIYLRVIILNIFEHFQIYFCHLLKSM